ncbi:MAG: hypothetical protein DLM71_08390 [Chloroflexi bacterium]|nr:MAG: hypothetical protein DLM71_08390 [Chloroflexota bacterium]
MIRSLASTAVLVLKRAAAHRLVLAAAAIIVLLSTTLLSAGVIYADAVSTSGLRRVLSEAAADAVNVEVSARASARDDAAVDAGVQWSLRWALAGFSPVVVRSGQSDSFALPGQGANVRKLTRFAFSDGVAAHARLVAGRWPAAKAASGAIDSAISVSTADLLGLRPGDQLVLISRLDPGFRTTARIVGVFAVANPGDPFWFADSALLRGIEHTENFDTYGPIFVTRPTFLSLFGGREFDLRWRAFPDFGRLTVSGAGDLQARVNGLLATLNGSVPRPPAFSIATRLGSILGDAQRSLLVTQTSVVLVTLQLIVLAGYALLLSTTLVVDQRRVETALLRSRGASAAQVAGLAALEGLIIIVPAVAAAPWLAALALRGFNAVGPLAAIRLQLDPAVSPQAYELAVATGIGCLAMLVLPSYRSARSVTAARASRGRPGAGGLLQRGGVDVALLLVAALAVWQLRRYGAPLTASLRGQLGIDPLLVGAPAIAMLAGGLLALRLVPRLAQAAEWLAVGGRGIVSSLGTWQLSRRHGRYGRASLLLVLSIALAMFGLSYSATWTQSQRDQADFQVGADVRVAPDQGQAAVPAAVLANAYRASGGETVLPVLRTTTALPNAIPQVLALDASHAASVMRLRADLGSAAFEGALADLARQRPMPALPALSGTPVRVRVRTTLAAQLDRGQAAPPFRLDLVARDAGGLLHRFNGGPLALGRSVIDVGLTDPLAGGTPAYPLTIVAIELGAPVPLNSVSGSFEIAGVEAVAADGKLTPVALASTGWRAVAHGGGNRAPGRIELGRRLGATFETGARLPASTASITFSIEPVALHQSVTSIPAVVSGPFLDAVGGALGDSIPMDLGPPGVAVRATARQDLLPAVDAARPAIVVDLPTLALLDYAATGDVTEPNEWWVATSHPDEFSAAISGPPFSSRSVIGRAARARSLQTDPVALGIVGALALGALAAAVFGAIGFAATAAVGARERSSEFGLLRALGLAPRQLTGWLVVENGFLALVSLLIGTGLGVLLIWLVIPFVTVSREAGRVVPDPLVIIPWAPVAVVDLALLVVVALLVAGLTRRLAQLGLSAVLRSADD